MPYVFIFEAEYVNSIFHRFFNLIYVIQAREGRDYAKFVIEFWHSLRALFYSQLTKLNQPTMHKILICLHSAKVLLWST
jgi:hypothetical protein